MEVTTWKKCFVAEKLLKIIEGLYRDYLDFFDTIQVLKVGTSSKTEIMSQTSCNRNMKDRAS